MLRIAIPAAEIWDEEREEFFSTKSQILQLEHSLVSLSKWEAIWCKPFLTGENKTFQETLSYIRCMTLTQNVPPQAYHCLTDAHMDAISAYISAPMTATRLPKTPKGRPNREQMTSELIYYAMIALNIPFECQKWHLNRLLTLIEVCNIKNQPPKRRSRTELMNRNAALNAARRKKWNTRG